MPIADSVSTLAQRVGPQSSVAIERLSLPVKVTSAHEGRQKHPPKTRPRDSL
jgi:hypothetical protein